MALLNSTQMLPVSLDEMSEHLDWSPRVGKFIFFKDTVTHHHHVSQLSMRVGAKTEPCGRRSCGCANCVEAKIRESAASSLRL